MGSRGATSMQLVRDRQARGYIGGGHETRGQG